MLALAWRWTVGIFAVFGAASFLSVAALWLNFLLTPESIRYRALPAVSPVAREIAGKIAPELKSLATEYKPNFLAEAEKRGVRPANFSVGAMNAVIDFLCMNYPEEYQLRSRP